MEEQDNQIKEEKVAGPKKESNTKKWIGGAILVVVLLVIGVFVVDTIQKNQKKEAIKDVAVGIGTEVASNAVEEAQENAANDADNDVTTVEIEGSNFEFSLADMSFSPGEKVKLTLKVTEGTHNFVIDELGVVTDVIAAGEEVTVEFTVPDEPGEYAYYCSVGNHRALGMEGVLTVE